MPSYRIIQASLATLTPRLKSPSHYPILELEAPMFFSTKILKPDVPPKRCRPKLPSLWRWITRLFFPARHSLSIGNAITEQGSSSKWKVFRRHRP